jgi:hypothetical protein
MSLELVKDQIGRFLGTAEPEVMAIRGAWGVGKTFTWKKYLDEASRRDDGIALK